MATRAQAKVAIDNAVTDAKADMDNIIPANADYMGNGSTITFGPTGYTMQFNAAGSASAAATLLSAIKTALTAASRPWIEFRSDRRTDDSGRRRMGLTETSGKLTVVIVNF